jgi:hypothetical protein
MLELVVTNDVVGVVPGQLYGFRYRAQNKFGWGEFSDEVFYLAAAVPLQADPVMTEIENLYVKFFWNEPDD